MIAGAILSKSVASYLLAVSQWSKLEWHITTLCTRSARALKGGNSIAHQVCHPIAPGNCVFGTSIWFPVLSI